jgi:hypothetical protein
MIKEIIFEEYEDNEEEDEDNEETEFVTCPDCGRENQRYQPCEH